MNAITQAPVESGEVEQDNEVDCTQVRLSHHSPEKTPSQMDATLWSYLWMGCDGTDWVGDG